MIFKDYYKILGLETNKVNIDEIRQIIGIKPSDDPKANMLNNSNIRQPLDGDSAYEQYVDESQPEYSAPEEYTDQ